MSSKDPKPAAPEAESEWFCLRCCDIVSTTRVTGFSTDPFSHGRQVTSPPICSKCNAGVVRYSPHELATAIKSQMTLLDAAKRVDEENRRLKHQLDEKNREVSRLTSLHWHPDSCRIINESEASYAGVIGKVRIGWVGKVFPLTNQGLADGMEYMNQKSGLLGNSQETQKLKDEVEQLRKIVAELREQIQKGALPPRSQRSIGL